MKPTEVVSFLGHDYPAYFWEMAMSFLVMLALLSLYYALSLGNER